MISTEQPIDEYVCAHIIHVALIEMNEPEKRKKEELQM